MKNKNPLQALRTLLLMLILCGGVLWAVFVGAIWLILGGASTLLMQLPFG